MEEIRGLVDETVKDPETADKLKAYYNQFCKRPTFNDHYLATFNRDNVELVDVSPPKASRPLPSGIVANGKEYEWTALFTRADLRSHPATTASWHSHLRHGWTIYLRTLAVRQARLGW